MRSRVLLIVGSLVLLVAAAAFRDVLLFRRRASAEGPIPGPPGDVAREHLPSVQVDLLGPGYPLRMMSPSATDPGNGDRVPDTEFWDLERCFAAELRQLTFPSHASEDIFHVTENYRLSRKGR
jgi:hypothetical protein